MTITAEELKRLIIDELNNLNFSFDENGGLIPPSSEKKSLQLLHKPARDIALEKAKGWIEKKWPFYQKYFAHGYEISPLKIKPKLVKVSEKWHSDLFRLARYYWSIPYSYGFGRRLRYIIFDDNNQKLIGIFGLQSPPIGFPARDILFKYPEGRKTEFVNQTMDIFTLGALPPYNRLLGGKLVALAVCSNEVRNDYRRLYENKKTEMEGRVLPAHLVALTTTSAFGRSSIYNRLKYKNVIIAQSLGFTNGYGNFHLQRLYPLFKEYLASEEISTRGGYGTGPKRTWQLMRRTLDKLGLPNHILRHGVKREVFIFPLIDNLKDYLEGKDELPSFRDLPFTTLAEYWNERWLKDRTKRVDGWHNWENQGIAESFILREATTESQL
jgi:uncharacterized protein DUF4338